MALIQEIQVPLLAVNDTTLTVVELCVAGGAEVKKGDLIMVFETSKTTYDVEAPADGFIQYLCEVDRDYVVNEVVARIYSGAAEAASLVSGPGKPATQSVAAPKGAAASPRPAIRPQTVAASTEPLPHWEGKTLFSHEAIRLMEAAGVDREAFAGRDFVTAAVVRAFLEPSPAAERTSQPLAVAHSGMSDATSSTRRAGGAPALPADPTKTILKKLLAAKKREIEYLSDIQSSGLTSTLHTQVETEGIFIPINRAQKHLKDSLLPVIIYETARLLTEYPLLNAYFTGDAIAVYKEVNPGFAIDIENKGLKVLKVAQAGQKSIGDIEAEILRLSGDYLDNNLQVEQVTDISFTITDLGAEGVAFFQPLINKMNSAILGVSAIDKKLHRCILSLTFDHRVTEGKTVANFLRELKERLESYRPDPAEFRRGITCFKCYKTLSEDLGGTGFVRCITPEGKEGYICQSCLKGF
jgi:pyruvate dehydrogenase E2 component (dihydrolipoamide acetyltransferase)